MLDECSPEPDTPCIVKCTKVLPGVKGRDVMMFWGKKVGRGDGSARVLEALEGVARGAGATFVLTRREGASFVLDLIALECMH